MESISALAATAVMPRLRRAIPYRPLLAAGIAASSGPIASGKNISYRSSRGNATLGGRTPTTVTVPWSTWSVRPSTAGSAPSSRRQKASVTIATGTPPARSSLGSNARPRAGAMPSVAKMLALKFAARSCRGPDADANVALCG